MFFVMIFSGKGFERFNVKLRVFFCVKKVKFNKYLGNLVVFFEDEEYGCMERLKVK